MASKGKIVMIFHVYDLETSGDGTICLPTISAEKIIAHMDDQSRRKLFEQHEDVEIPLVDNINKDPPTVWFGWRPKEKEKSSTWSCWNKREKEVEYVFKNFLELIKKYELKIGDILEFSPIVEKKEKLKLETNIIRRHSC